MECRVLKPFSLVMRENKCYYCDDIFKDIFDYKIEQLYGIRHCKEHKEFAERDCKSEMYKTRKVFITDALDKCEKFRKLISFLKITPINILRTNGDIDYGWCVPFSFEDINVLNSSSQNLDLLYFLNDCGDCNTIIRNQIGDWIIPFVKQNMDLKKRIGIKSVLNNLEVLKANEEIFNRENITPEFLESVCEEIDNLEFYKEEYISQKQILNEKKINGNSSYFPEDVTDDLPFIKKVGSECGGFDFRIFENLFFDL
jgi:hypothetical protein